MAGKTQFSHILDMFGNDDDDDEEEESRNYELHHLDDDDSSSVFLEVVSVEPISYSCCR